MGIYRNRQGYKPVTRFSDIPIGSHQFRRISCTPSAVKGVYGTYFLYLDVYVHRVDEELYKFTVVCERRIRRGKGVNKTKVVYERVRIMESTIPLDFVEGTYNYLKGCYVMTHLDGSLDIMPIKDKVLYRKVKYQHIDKLKGGYVTNADYESDKFKHEKEVLAARYTAYRQGKKKGNPIDHLTYNHLFQSLGKSPYVFQPEEVEPFLDWLHRTSGMRFKHTLTIDGWLKVYGPVLTL
jgi:hypothetical protein